MVGHAVTSWWLDVFMLLWLWFRIQFASIRALLKIWSTQKWSVYYHKWLMLDNLGVPPLFEETRTSMNGVPHSSGHDFPNPSLTTSLGFSRATIASRWCIQDWVNVELSNSWCTPLMVMSNYSKYCWWLFFINQKSWAELVKSGCNRNLCPHYCWLSSAISHIISPSDMVI